MLLEGTWNLRLAPNQSLAPFCGSWVNRSTCHPVLWRQPGFLRQSLGTTGFNGDCHDVKSLKIPAVPRPCGSCGLPELAGPFQTVHHKIVLDCRQGHCASNSRTRLRWAEHWQLRVPNRWLVDSSQMFVLPGNSRSIDHLINLYN